MAVPDRWLKCPRKGQLLGGRFLPFKTPLSSRYDSKVPEEDRFDVSMLFTYLASKQCKLGMVVDLTNTTRFYSSKEVTDRGAKYFKVNCKGRGECPSVEQTNLFIGMCHNFIQKNPSPDQVIGVHCTHGFNRTGFLICAYFVEKMDWSIEMAVQAFIQARPPGIYKGEYIQELFRRYGDPDDALPPPELPEWCYGADDKDDDEQESKYNGDSRGPTSGPSKHEKIPDNKQFMEGVHGVEIVTEFQKLHHLRRRVEQLCQWQRQEFPGCQPVSMDNSNLQMLEQRHYKVSWKSDGIRYMLLIDGPGDIYFYDRDHTVFHAPQFTFPKRKDDGHISSTLVDGEMIMDTDEHDKPVPRFLVYDIVVFQGEEVGKMNFDIRLLCISKEIIGPRTQHMERGTINKAHEPFSIRAKEFWDITKTSAILSGKFCHQLAHETDGLVFQPWQEPYMPGRCHILLKWKPPSHNTVDFKLVIKKVEGSLGCLPQLKGLLYVNHMKQPFAEMKVTSELKKYDKKIIECNFDFQKRQWVFMRERTDKSFPNAYKTAMGVCESIRNPVTKEILLDFIENRAKKPSKRPGDQSSQSGKKRKEGPHSSGPGRPDQYVMPPPPPRI